jgi:PQQ-dependent dehydrogenase (methanol/ethanol family)
MRRALFIALLALATSGAPLPAATAVKSDWPSYNRTLASNRFAPDAEINRNNLSRLHVICTYDTKEMNAFQSGLVEVGDRLYLTTEHDTIALDPNDCKVKWRVHEDVPNSPLGAARGVAYLDGRVFRGGSDGRVRAYDAATGKRLWATQIASPQAGETIPAAPIAWNGLVFIGQAGGDNRGVKGRMYALDAATGKIVWEFYLVPKAPGDKTWGPEAPAAPAAVAASWQTAPGFGVTGGATWTSYSLDPATGLLYVPGGNPAPDFVKRYRRGNNLFTDSLVVLDARTGAYRRHVQLVQHDFHDWDVAAPAALIHAGGRHLAIVAPKNGRLYGINLADGRIAYRVPVTTVSNENVPLSPKGVRFCPGSQGGEEWNSPAYDKTDGTIITGQVDWCTTVHTDPKAAIQSVALAQPWSGSKDGFGIQDPTSKWAGWLTSSDVTTGARKWQFKAPFPILGGVTATAGGLVLFGDMGGNFYAMNSSTGAKLWSQNLGGAVGGGVITYDTGEGQKIAVAAGMTSPIWPTKKVTGRVVILGLTRDVR